MLNYLARRVPQIVPTLLFASMFAFIMLRLVPGDVTDVLAVEGGVSEEQKAQIRKDLGLDQPVPIQYVQWVSHMVTGDFGRSYWTNVTVTRQLEHALPKTLQLTAVSLVIALAIGLPLGILAGAFKGSVFDYAGTILATLMISVPTFAIGIVLLLVFAVWLQWLPATGSLILPAIVLGVDISGTFVRTLRTDIRAEMNSDYVRTALSKGLPQRTVLVRHVLPNSVTATLTIFGLVLGNLLGGTLIIESIFNWPGIGALTILAVQNRDYPVVQTLVMLMTVMFVLSNLLVDLLNGLVDPRVRE